MIRPTFLQNSNVALDIDRTYGQKKPLVIRTPLDLPSASLHHSSSESLIGNPLASSSKPAFRPHRSFSDSSSQTSSYDMLSDTPATASGTDTEAEEIEELTLKFPRQVRSGSVISNASVQSLDALSTRAGTYQHTRRKPMTLHDLNTRYFHQDVVIFRNFDIFRARDFGFALTVLYTICSFVIMPSLSPWGQTVAIATNAILCRLFHSFALGLVLKKQSESKMASPPFPKGTSPFLNPPARPLTSKHSTMHSRATKGKLLFTKLSRIGKQCTIGLYV